MSQCPRSRRTIPSRAQSGGAATEPHTFIAPPEGVRRWPTYSFNARARVHSLQPVLRPSGFCSKAFRACPFRCIAQPAVKCINGCRKTHRSGPHEYRALPYCRVVLEPRLKVRQSAVRRTAERAGALGSSNTENGTFERALGPARGCGLPRAGPRIASRRPREPTRRGSAAANAIVPPLEIGARNR